MDVEALKRRVIDEIDRRADQLLEVSHQIHEHPELGWEERFAHDLLSSVLDDEGLAPTRGAYDLPTAFEARAGNEGPLVAVLCEYDALPGVGHACGHNIIAAAGLGAALAAATVAEEFGGRVMVLGTPAEEGKQKINIDGREFLLEKPLRADFALVHAFLADYLGNLSYALTARNFNPLVAMAAATVIAGAEHIVPVGLIAPDHVVTPAPLVDYLVANA